MAEETEGKLCFLRSGAPPPEGQPHQSAIEESTAKRNLASGQREELFSQVASSLIRHPTFQLGRLCLRKQMEMQKLCQLPLCLFWEGTGEI